MIAYAWCSTLVVATWCVKCPIAKLRYLPGKKQLLRGQPPESIAIDVTEIPIEHPRQAQLSLDLLHKSKTRTPLLRGSS